MKHDFRKFKTIRTFSNDIRNNFIIMYMLAMNKTIQQNILVNLKVKQPQHDSYLKKVTEDVLKSAMTFLQRREIVCKAFESGLFSRLKQSKQLSNDYKCSSIGCDISRLVKNHDILH